MPPIVSRSNSRSARLGFRATPEQEAVIRRAAEMSHKSLSDFILQSAYAVAEQTLLDQRLFIGPGSKCADLLELRATGSWRPMVSVSRRPLNR